MSAYFEGFIQYIAFKSLITKQNNSHLLFNKNKI